MRIAILHFRFKSSESYAENVYANTLCRLGHEVIVFSTGRHCTEYDALEVVNVAQDRSFRVCRSKTMLQFGSTLIPLGGQICQTIASFMPEIAIMLAPHHGPAVFWMKALPHSCKVISGFSDLSWHHRNHFVWKYLKKPWIRKVLRRSDLVLAMTEDTRTFFENEFPDISNLRMEMCGLFYDGYFYSKKSNHFSGEMSEIDEYYSKYDKVVSLITRTNEKKGIEVILSQVKLFIQKNPSVGFALVGITDDAYGEKLRLELRECFPEGRCLTLPMVSTLTVKVLCERSFVTLWPLVSIGIQQSMACGCPALVKASMPTQHFMKSGCNGLYYRDDCSDLEMQLARSLNLSWDRDEVKHSISKYASENALICILQLVMGES